MKNLLLVFIVFTLVFSCKKEEKNENTIKTIEQVETIKNEFIVKVNFKTNINDQFTLSLKNIKKDEFQTKKIEITEKISSTTSFDAVEANFGENISNNFSIDFGRKDVKEIQLQSIDFSYGINNLKVLPADFEKYFKVNNYIEFDSSTGVLKTLKINNKVRPIVVLKRNAINILKKKNKL